MQSSIANIPASVFGITLYLRQNNSVSYFSEQLQGLMLALYFLNTWEVFKYNDNEIKLDRKRKDVFFAHSVLLVIANFKKIKITPLWFEVQSKCSTKNENREHSLVYVKVNGLYDIMLVNKMLLFSNPTVKKIVGLWYQPPYCDGWCWFC